MTATAELFRAAADAADRLLAQVYRLDVSKALDPLDPDDFDVIVGRLSDALRRAVRGYERDALRDAVNQLDVDWVNLSTAQRGRIIQAARYALLQPSFLVLPHVDRVFRVEGDFIAGATRRRFIGLIEAAIQGSFQQRDERIVQWLRTSQSAFVTDEYGRRSERASELARQVVADGLDQGLGSADIADDLRTQLSDMLARRSDNYWSVIASSFAGRARTFGAIASMRDAGIEVWRYVAMLDEVTCDTCRFLDGQVFSVDGGYNRFVSASNLTNPEDIRTVMPWVRHGRDEDGRRTLYIRMPDGSRETIATVERSGVGEIDDRGEYSGATAARRLEEIGCNMPPVHGRCRCEVVAEVV